MITSSYVRNLAPLLDVGSEIVRERKLIYHLYLRISMTRIYMLLFSHPVDEHETESFTVNCESKSYLDSGNVSIVNNKKQTILLITKPSFYHFRLLYLQMV